MHVADAVAVDKLIKSLSAQTQLETLEVTFGEPSVSNSDDIPSDADSDGELDPYHALVWETHEHRWTLVIVTQMFAPAWLSLCRFVEDSNMFRLRCDTT